MAGLDTAALRRAVADGTTFRRLRIDRAAELSAPPRDGD